MEENKSKRNKRSKKKKNKQATKPTENLTLDSGESTSDSQQNHFVERGEFNNGQVYGTTDDQGDVGGHMDTVKACFLEKINELQAEKDAQIQKQGSLAQKIQQLLQELDARSQKEASLARKILYLEAEKESWLKKEDSFEEKINQLVQEADVLNSTLVSLQEVIKDMEQERDSWILKENSNKESIANLTNDNAQLQAQVNELYAELDRRDKIRTRDIYAPSGDESTLMPDMVVKTAQAADSVSEISQQSSMSDGIQPLEDVMVEYKRNGEVVHVNDGYKVQYISEITEADDGIVQIPLDENEVRAINSIGAGNYERTNVPLTDAPLIGAPFRLISFVARYVSGADLVK